MRVLLIDVHARQNERDAGQRERPRLAPELVQGEEHSARENHQGTFDAMSLHAANLSPGTVERR